VGGVTPPASCTSHAGRRRAAAASARGPWPRSLTSDPVGRPQTRSRMFPPPDPQHSIYAFKTTAGRQRRPPHGGNVECWPKATLPVCRLLAGQMQLQPAYIQSRLGRHHLPKRSTWRRSDARKVAGLGLERPLLQSDRRFIESVFQEPHSCLQGCPA